MPTPKFRTSASKRDMRRSHHALVAPGISSCPACGEIRRPHTVCGACGQYKGGAVVAPKATSEWNGEDFNPNQQDN